MVPPPDGDNGLVGELLVPLDPEVLDPELVDPELLDPELLDPELLDPELLDPVPLLVLVLAAALSVVETQNAALPAATVVSDAAMSAPVTVRARRVPVVRSDMGSPFLSS